MSLTGALSTMPLPDLLQWLGTAGKTGTLQVERNRLKKWILIDSGRIVACSSDDPPQRLGQYLLSRELISPEQLRESLALQRESGQHLGAILVERGVLTAEDLTRHLTAKAEETIYSAFDWDEGVFRFEPALAERADLYSVNLPIQDVLLRGLKRFDDMQRIRQVFDDPSIVLRYTSIPPGAEIFRNRMARAMYGAIDGDRSVAELLLHVHGSEYVVYKFLFELHRNGYIEIAGRKAPAPAPPAAELPEIDLGPMLDLPPADAPARPGSPSRPASAAATASPPRAAAKLRVPASDEPIEVQLQSARDLMARGQFEQALDVLDTLYRQHPGDDSLRRLTAEAEAEFVDRTYRHFLRPEMVPALARPIETLSSETLSPQEFFLLSRIDGIWDLKSIIAVAPLREIEALRTLKRMRELGMIVLHDPH